MGVDVGLLLRAFADKSVVSPYVLSVNRWAVKMGCSSKILIQGAVSEVVGLCVDKC